MIRTDIGPKQREALNRLKRRSEIADPADRVLSSLVRRGHATALPLGKRGSEFRISYDGCVAIGATIPDEQEDQAA